MWRTMDNAATHNASITKKYLLEQKIRLLDNPACSPDLNLIENLWVLNVAKIYEGQQFSAISELKNAWEINTFGSTSEISLIVCLAEFLKLSKQIYKILDKKFAFIFYSSAH